jgi:Skp family chaperone for outer membrane proteins
MKANTGGNGTDRVTPAAFSLWRSGTAAAGHLEEENGTVKRTFLCAAAGVVTAGVLAYVGSLWADPPGAAPQQPAAKHRVALLNLNYVLKNYQELKDFQSQVKDKVTVYQEKEKANQARMEKIKGDVAKTTDAALKAKYEKEMKDVARGMQDEAEEAKGVLGKMSDEKMVEVFKKVQGTTIRYAQSHGFDLVLHYNDALPNEPEYYSPMNVARKIQAGACMPMHWTQGMDISHDVLETLNAAYKPAGAAAAPPAGGGAVRPASATKP